MKNAASLTGQILAQAVRSATDTGATTTGKTERKWGASSALKHLAEFDAYRPELVKMRAAAAEFIAAMYNHEEPYALVFLGPSGTGKTTLVKLINRFFRRYMAGTLRHVDADISPEGERWLCAGGFINWGAALREMLDTGEWGRMGAYRGDYFLALDDIMSEHEKKRELSASKLYEILTDRHGRRWTAITANYGLGEIENRLEPRIASRLPRDRNVCIELPADLPDYGLRPKK